MEESFSCFLSFFVLFPFSLVLYEEFAPCPTRGVVGSRKPPSFSPTFTVAVD